MAPGTVPCYSSACINLLLIALLPSGIGLQAWRQIYTEICLDEAADMGISIQMTCKALLTRCCLRQSLKQDAAPGQLCTPATLPVHLCFQLAQPAGRQSHQKAYCIGSKESKDLNCVEWTHLSSSNRRCPRESKSIDAASPQPWKPRLLACLHQLFNVKFSAKNAYWMYCGKRQENHLVSI